MDKGFDEFIKVGLVDEKPVRFSGAQAEGCAPIAQAFAEGRHARTLAPQGERRVLFARDLVDLLTADAQPALKVEAHADYLQVEPLTLAAVDADRSLELWAIPEGGKPVSLGLIPEDGEGIIGLSPRQQASISQPVELMVSSESKGGSVTRQPTGPTVYQGALASR